MRAAAIDEDMSGTVHRLETEALLLDLDRAEHALTEVLEMSGDLVHLLADDMRRDDALVPALAQAFADELLDQPAHDRALGVPEDQAAAGVLFDREQVELAAQLAVITLLRLLDLVKIRVELSPGRERGSVDALQHGIALVAAPVRARHAQELEPADLARALGVTAAAEIGEGADRVERDRLAFGNLARDLGLVRIARETSERRLARVTRSPVISSFARMISPIPLPRACRDPLGRERLGAVEVVVETILDRRTDGRFGIGEEVLDGVSKHVRGGVPERDERGRRRRDGGGAHAAQLALRAGPSSDLHHHAPGRSLSPAQLPVHAKPSRLYMRASSSPRSPFCSASRGSRLSARSASPERRSSSSAW